MSADGRRLECVTTVEGMLESRKGVNLPRLRAATRDVIAILRDTNSITTPPLDSLYVLSESQPN